MHRGGAMKRLLSIFLMTAMLVTAAFSYSAEPVSAASTKYWLKVNRQANVVNVYRKTSSSKKWKIYKVMLCSTGVDNGTPCGTYSIAKKWKWQPLYGGHYGYCTTQFYHDFLFHSVYYNVSGKHNSLLNAEYNKLGTQASLGCVRMCAMDAKWVYDVCPAGTKVTVYEDKNPGPLGKPKGFKVKGKTGWDPTDPDKKNPDFRMTGPKITIKKSKLRTITVGSKYNLKKGVTAKSPYTYQNLTSKLKVHAIYKKNLSGKYVKLKTKKLNTSKAGKYRIVYSCYDKWCGKKTVYKSLYLTIKPKDTPRPDPDEESGNPDEGTEVDPAPVVPDEPGDEAPGEEA